MSQYPQYPQSPNPQDPNNPAAYNAGPYAPNPYGATPYNPNPYGPLSYATPAAPEKPTSVTVLAIFAIILGGLGTLCTGLGVVGAVFQLAGGSLFPALTAQYKPSPGVQAFQVVAVLVGLALAVSLLAVGIGGVTLKPWALKLAVPGWSAAMIAWALIRFVLQVAWLNPASMALVKQIQQSQGARGGAPPAQLQGFMSSTMVASAFISLLLELVMPVCFLMFWRRPHVVAAFESGAAPPAGGYGNP